MMKNDIPIGKNRTGIGLSPVDQRALVEAADATVPSMEGDESEIAAVRAEYLDEGEPLGSMPPPATVKGAGTAVVDAVKGANANVLLDKLGERLAFERTGTRLYEALISKAEGSEPLPGGPTLEDLARIRDEELAHFEMLTRTMIELGGDPTSVTPSADVAAVSSMGLVKVLSDPRVSLKQSLDAILIAELVDNDCWTILIQLARGAGHDAIATRFEQALAEEENHLALVRAWVSGTTIGQAKPGGPVKAMANASKTKKKATH